MISVSQATKIINSKQFKGKIIEIPIENALHHILAEDIYSDRAFPPFDRVCMDGIAIQFSTYEKGQRVYEIEGIQAAGLPKLTLKNSENALEAMTGAILPTHTDTIIPYEHLLKTENGFEIIKPIKKGQNIQYKGSDAQENSLIISKGKMIKSPDISILATVGKSMIKVYAKPKIAIISTGNELVDIHETPKEYQIRKSNSITIRSILNQLNFESDLFHLDDEFQSINDFLKNNTDYDIFLFSGGVSAGKFDFIPKVLEENNFNIEFHKIAQKPGKPMLFATKNNQFVFGLPGNPNSTLICFHRYVLPWLEGTYKPIKVKNQENINPNELLTLFISASINRNQKVKIQQSKGSGDMVSIVETDGFIEVPAHENDKKKLKFWEFI